MTDEEGQTGCWLFRLILKVQVLGGLMAIMVGVLVGVGFEIAVWALILILGRCLGPLEAGRRVILTVLTFIGVFLLLHYLLFSLV